jgi:hypothetical protein
VLVPDDNRVSAKPFTPVDGHVDSTRKGWNPIQTQQKHAGSYCALIGAYINSIATTTLQCRIRHMGVCLSQLILCAHSRNKRQVAALLMRHVGMSVPTQSMHDSYAAAASGSRPQPCNHCFQLLALGRPYLSPAAQSCAIMRNLFARACFRPFAVQPKQGFCTASLCLYTRSTWQ